MVKPRLVAGIDVGCTKICAVAGELDGDGSLGRVVMSRAATRGVQRGVVVDREAAAAAVAEALDELQAASRWRIESLLLGVSTAVESLNSQGSTTTAHARRPITPEDVQRAVQAATEAAGSGDRPRNREVVHVVPRGFTVDGRSGISNPVGLFGRRIDVEAHVVTVAKPMALALVGCVERWGAEVEELVAQPLASAQAVLSPEERERGVAAADMGAACTGLCLFVDGNPWRTTTVPVGGRHLTQDVATVLGITYEVAEDLKLAVGHATAGAIDPGEELEVALAEGPQRFRVARRELCEIIEARAQELIGLIGEEIRRSGYAGLLPAGLVLTGGTAQLPGIARLASEMLQMRVRIGQPEATGEATRAKPTQASAVGLLLWACRGPDRGWSGDPAVAPAGTSTTSRRTMAGRWLRALRPGARDGQRPQ